MGKVNGKECKRIALLGLAEHNLMPGRFMMIAQGPDEDFYELPFECDPNHREFILKAFQRIHPLEIVVKKDAEQIEGEGQPLRAEDSQPGEEERNPGGEASAIIG